MNTSSLLSIIFTIFLILLSLFGLSLIFNNFKIYLESLKARFLGLFILSISVGWFFFKSKIRKTPKESLDNLLDQNQDRIDRIQDKKRELDSSIEETESEIDNINHEIQDLLNERDQITKARIPKKYISEEDYKKAVDKLKNL